ncbi:DUF2508 domain-containing protein [Paenibacillus sp. 481]|uniref:DUF2508 domain-containing protein n=1 Tax=Paenibacillus sp. 481 TaxID=2835869 RepID=UPI001E36E2A5|nr:DUF2508 domain-containing protein [Paenibacillus sp. 481]UHA75232.1 DUF2508 domain-containing protein [Paenibacillus sp. 481]
MKKMLTFIQELIDQMSQRGWWFKKDNNVKFCEHTEQLQTLSDLQLAYKDWEAAHIRFDYANGDDEIDYAICTLEASEKRIAMVLKKAKKMRIHALMVERGQ